jgi:hypothetical protein
MPNSRNRHQINSIKDRKRYSLLAGADLYVARFGAKRSTLGKLKQTSTCCDNTTDAFENQNDGEALSRTSTSTASTTSSSSTGSLHDELSNPHPRCTTSPRPSSPDPFDWSTVHASRPCYRCVSYMHSVGIKRVFWTNDEGKWEGAKVRELVDALDTSTTTFSGSEDGGKKLLESGVYITKHEVLMMRRLMGDS